MDTVLQKVLKKLDEIDDRLGKLEFKPTPVAHAGDAQAFKKAVVFVLSKDEVTQSELQHELKIDAHRASKLMDELERAGYGKCSMEERENLI